MTYDLRGLRLHRIVRRTPGAQRYTINSSEAHAAFLYTTLHRQLRLRPRSTRASGRLSNQRHSLQHSVN